MKTDTNHTASRQLAFELDAPLTAPVEGDVPPVRLRASARARHLQIKVSPLKGIEVIVPRRRTAREVEQFIASHREWIDDAWQRLRREYPDAGTVRLPQRIAIPLMDAAWTVRYTEAGRLQENAGALVVPHAGDVTATALKLQDWLRKKAREALPRRLERWSVRTGLAPGNIVIRGQATRWGSCSTRGTISLNFRLLFLEKPQIDCLLLHELCHLKHLNHGKRFWGLMEKHMAGARERDRALGEGWKDVPPWALVK